VVRRWKGKIFLSVGGWGSVFAKLDAAVVGFPRSARFGALYGLWCKVAKCCIIASMAAAAKVEALFKGRQFDQEIIVLCVRWYLRYKLSTRDLVEMMAERGVVLVHTTILRWVQHYVPEFEKCWGHYARPVGGSWRCDETYVKVKGKWTYLYRAVDKVGRTVDVYLSERQDVNPVKHFFRKAMTVLGHRESSLAMPTPLHTERFES
jgi:hypothetical protein